MSCGLSPGVYLRCSLNSTEKPWNGLACNPAKNPFNRSAAHELRRRLHALVGDDAVGVTVLTYHALALRLTGTSLAQAAERDARVEFDAILAQATDLLEGRAHPGDEANELRERLLRGYRYVLVDEYQDIDELQYRPNAAPDVERLCAAGVYE